MPVPPTDKLSGRHRSAIPRARTGALQHPADGRDLPTAYSKAAGSGTLSTSDDAGSACNGDSGRPEDRNKPAAGAGASHVVHDVIAMGVGAVMALHFTDEANARTALDRVAARQHVPVSVVAQAVLTLLAGTDQPIGDGAGRAAAQLLVQGFTNSP